MEALLSVLPYIQITLAVLLTVAILMQQRGAGLGSAFGGGDGAVHYERRGAEKTLFQSTVVIAILFVVAVAIPLLVKNSQNTTTPMVDVTPTLENATTTNILKNIEITTEEGNTTETKEVKPVNTLGIPTE